MSVEIQMLACAIVLGLVGILLAAALATQQRGVAWNLGNREGTTQALVGVAARAQRASANFLETFPLFAAATLAVVVSQHATRHTALGAQVYVWARAAYLPVYLLGIPYVRTLVYAVSLWGLLQLLEALF
jgi:uncharacterized MAPEG superfamily protein